MVVTMGLWGLPCRLAAVAVWTHNKRVAFVITIKPLEGEGLLGEGSSQGGGLQEVVGQLAGQGGPLPSPAAYSEALRFSTLKRLLTEMMDPQHQVRLQG